MTIDNETEFYREALAITADAVAIQAGNEYGIDGYNSFLGEVQRRLIEMNLNPPKWPDTIRGLGDLDAALDSCTEWCADRLNEIARLNAATKELK